MPYSSAVPCNRTVLYWDPTAGAAGDNPGSGAWVEGCFLDSEAAPTPPNQHLLTALGVGSLVQRDYG